MHERHFIVPPSAACGWGEGTECSDELLKVALMAMPAFDWLSPYDGNVSATYSCSNSCQAIGGAIVQPADRLR